MGRIKKGSYRYQQSSFLQNVSKLVANILKEGSDEWQSLGEIAQKAVRLDGENHPPTREQILAVSNVLRGLKKRKLVELREMSLLKKRGEFSKIGMAITNAVKIAISLRWCQSLVCLPNLYDGSDGGQF